MTGYNAEQIAAFYLLRLRCWVKGALPNNMSQLVRWCNNDVAQEAIQSILDEHFEQTESGDWFCPALEDLREQAMKKRNNLSDAGKRGNEARWGKKDAAVSDPIATRSPTSPTRSQREEEGDVEEEGEKKERESEKERESTPAAPQCLVSLPPSPPAEFSPEAERIAAAVSMTAGSLMAGSPDRLTPVQRQARIRVSKLLQPPQAEAA